MTNFGFGRQKPYKTNHSWTETKRNGMERSRSLPKKAWQRGTQSEQKRARGFTYELTWNEALLAHRYELYGSFNAMPRHVRRTSCRSAVPNPGTTPSLGVSASPLLLLARSLSLSPLVAAFFFRRHSRHSCLPNFRKCCQQFLASVFFALHKHPYRSIHTYIQSIYTILGVYVWQCVCEFVQGNVVYLLLGFVSCQQHLKRPNKKRRQQGVKLPDSGRKVASLSLSLSLSLSPYLPLYLSLSIMLAAGLIILWIKSRFAYLTFRWFRERKTARQQVMLSLPAFPTPLLPHTSPLPCLAHSQAFSLDPGLTEFGCPPWEIGDICLSAW